MAGTVLITGCSTGIGRATAEAFTADDWTVYATARNPDDVADFQEKGAETAELDVTEDDQVERVVDRVIDEQGRIDCLVNNAGMAQAGALEEVPADELAYQFDVNVFGGHRLARSVLPHMRDQGDGTIVNVSSIAGLVAFPGMGPYCGTKYAIEGLSDALRVEVAPFGIDVVLVEPGWVRTPIGEKGEASMEAVTSDGSPYERLHENAVIVKDFFMSDPVSGTVEEVAETILTAANADNPKARYVTVTNGKLLARNQYLPDSIQDWMFEKLFWGPLASIRS